MRSHPIADPLDRHLLARDEIALNQHALDRAIAITVVRVVAQPQRRAILEYDARGAFDLDREQIERILQPAYLELLTIERAGLYRGAVVVRARARCSRYGGRSARLCSERRPRLGCSRRPPDRAAGDRAGHGIRG